MTGFYNRESKCLLRGTDWGFKCNSGEFNIAIRSEARKRSMHTAEQAIYKGRANTHVHIYVYIIYTHISVCNIYTTPIHTQNHT